MGQITKLKPWEKFVVIEINIEDSFAVIQKQKKKFLTRQYKVPGRQLMKLPRKEAIAACKRISELTPISRLEASAAKAPTIHTFNSSEEDFSYAEIISYTREENIQDYDFDCHVSEYETSTTSDRLLDNVTMDA